MDEVRVVVGVDGSDGSRSALRHAVLEAHRRGARVHAVTAHEPVDPWTWPWSPDLLPPQEEVEQNVATRSRVVVDEVLDDLRGGGRPVVPVDVEVRRGDPVTVLTEAGQGAALLVVGHRGHRTGHDPVLGKVGLGCLAHLPCALTVVPPRPERRTGRAARSDARSGAA